MESPHDQLLHLTDFHFWEVVLNPLRLLNKRIIGNFNVAANRRHEFLTDRATAYARHVASLGIDNALLTGDFASTATEREMKQGADFVRLLQGEGIHSFVIPGNHDVYTFESVRKRRFEHHFKPWLPSEPLPCRIALPGGTPIVLAPTVRANWITSRGAISDEDVGTIAQLLDNETGPVVVAGHYPVLHKTETYDASSGRRLLNAEAFRHAMGQSGKTILYLSGHTHRFSLTVDEMYPNVLHLTTAAFFWENEVLDTLGEFSEIGFGNGALEIRRHVNRGAWNVENQDLKGFSWA